MQHPIEVAGTLFGSQTELARMLGVTKSAVNQWKDEGRQVPIEHCAAIEQATDRQVMRWDLRPDDWWRIWPELIGQAGAPQVKQAA